MLCPFCAHSNTFVKDSRDTENGVVTRRRRCCEKCNGRFTTFERIQMREIIVVKKSGAKKIFDRNKIYKSIATAVRKRNVADEVIDGIINKIVLEIENKGIREISTREIGEFILQALATMDQVAYIRFTSVYKDFNSIKDFAKFINKIKLVNK